MSLVLIASQQSTTKLTGSEAKGCNKLTCSMNNADQQRLHIASQHGRQQLQESRMIASEEPERSNPTSQTFGTTIQHTNAQCWIEALASQHAAHQGAQQQIYQLNQQIPTQQLALQLSLLAQQARDGQLSHDGSFQQGVVSAATQGRQVPLDALSYFGLQQLSSSLGRIQQALGSNNQAPMQQQDPLGVSTQLATDLSGSLRASTVSEYVPQSESLAFSEGASIVPCRARRMPKDHHAQTAYFVLPKDIAHGDGLRCSHIQCQNKGIRFVYCRVCDVPVAKINFSTRHKHGDAQDASSLSSSEEKPRHKRTSSVSLGDDEKAKDQRNGHQGSNDGIPPDVAIESELSGEVEKIFKTSKRMRTFHCMPAGESRHSFAVSMTSNSSGKQSHQSIALTGTTKPLKHAPPNLTSHHKVGVESGSDITSSYQEAPPRANGTSSSHERKKKRRTKKWISLLDERPATLDREKMKTWLMRLTLFSDPTRRLSPAAGSYSSARGGVTGQDSDLAALVGEGLAAAERLGRHADIAPSGEEESSTNQDGKSENGDSQSSSGLISDDIT